MNFSDLKERAQLIFSGKRRDHVTPLLRKLYWLCGWERISCEVVSGTFGCQHGTAPSNLSSDLRRVYDKSDWSHLNSTLTTELLVPRTWSSAIGDLTMSVDGDIIWNSLPPSVVTVTTPKSFNKSLKTHLCQVSFLSLFVL